MNNKIAQRGIFKRYFYQLVQFLRFENVQIQHAEDPWITEDAAQCYAFDQNLARQLFDL